MKNEILETGVIFRGYTVVNHFFKNLPELENFDTDLRNSFLTAINAFIQCAYKNSYLEYLEMDDILFMFKIEEIQSSDFHENEPLIFYILIEKFKNPDKILKKFNEKVMPLIQQFKMKYNRVNFSKVSQFRPFKEQLKDYFT